MQIVHGVMRQSFAAVAGKRSTFLKFYDGGSRESISGIRATIFGATGFLGPYVRINQSASQQPRRGFYFRDELV